MSNFGYPMAYAAHEQSGDVLCPECIKQEQPTVWANYYDKGQKITKLDYSHEPGCVYEGQEVDDTWDGVWMCESADYAEDYVIQHCDHCHKRLTMVTIIHDTSPSTLACYDAEKCSCEDCSPELYPEGWDD